MNRICDRARNLAEKSTEDLVRHARERHTTALELALVFKLEELMQKVEELEEEKQILLGRPGII